MRTPGKGDGGLRALGKSDDSVKNMQENPREQVNRKFYASLTCQTHVTIHMHVAAWKCCMMMPTLESEITADSILPFLLFLFFFTKKISWILFPLSI